MDTNSVPETYIFVTVWQAVPFFGLVLASAWLFRRASRAAGWLMLAGSVLKSCDVISKQFIFDPGIGLWPMKGLRLETLQLQHDIWTWLDRFGLLGLTLFMVGLVLFARQYSMRSGKTPPPTSTAHSDSTHD